MPIIKPRTRGKQFVRVGTRLDRENHETLHAYAAFIGEPPEYVLNQLIDTVLAQDEEFVAWRVEHQQSFVPPPPPATKRRRRSKPSADRTQSRGAVHAPPPASVQ